MSTRYWVAICPLETIQSSPQLYEQSLACLKKALLTLQTYLSGTNSNGKRPNQQQKYQTSSFELANTFPPNKYQNKISLEYCSQIQQQAPHTSRIFLDCIQRTSALSAKILTIIHMCIVEYLLPSIILSWITFVLTFFYNCKSYCSTIDQILH